MMRLIIVNEDIQRIAFPGKIIFDAAQHQRAAVARRAGTHLVGGHPDRAHDAGVQRATRHHRAQFTAKRKAQVRESSPFAEVLTQWRNPILA